MRECEVSNKLMIITIVLLSKVTNLYFQRITNHILKDILMRGNDEGSVLSRNFLKTIRTFIL